MGYLKIEFIGLVLITFVIYYLIGKLFPKRQWFVLLVGSILFYASYDIKFFIFLFFSIITTFSAAIFMEKTEVIKKRKVILSTAIILNVFILVFIKYANYGLSLLGIASEKLGFTFSINSLDLIVPIGIAYYTMQIISYLVDVYRGKTDAERNLLRYTLYISFFPHIIQGPIPRKEQLYQTLFQSHSFDYNKMCMALQLIGWGIIKKMVIADRLNIFVGNVFANVQGYMSISVI